MIPPLYFTFHNTPCDWNSFLCDRKLIFFDRNLLVLAETQYSVAEFHLPVTETHLSVTETHFKCVYVMDKWVSVICKWNSSTEFWVSVTENLFLSQKISFCHRKLVSVRDKWNFVNKFGGIFSLVFQPSGSKGLSFQSRLNLNLKLCLALIGQINKYITNYNYRISH